MGKLRNIVTPLHKSTKRDYLARMVDDKVYCMEIAKQYDKDYWDGDRRYGYGGYKFMPGRWRPVAEKLINTYNLTSNSKVLDIGCGKGYLLYEMKSLIPDLDVVGIDCSDYGLENAKEEIKPFIYKYKAESKLPYTDKEFDLVISLGTFHNLRLPELKVSLSEMERVGRQGYLMLESYQNEKELFNLQCWALTAESFFDKEEWVWLYKYFGYTGDYEFIYFS
ncbi:class I SAM-dependent methyltransferase [Candidatus Woesearchaeota archaeon]|jgi:ubiquinone/menaquinone biosynthesis C-methylase UbiE|nr:class I SAM-dependent methyltransferase [Candidatus Woesearchaeota archaeon]MBT7555577.1 class I SAM-dependent methyltransferase [Candidatus Woesearchaeota archaeon]